MPRRARLAVAGIPWHIIQRDNNRLACFYCADDYLRYLKDLAGQAAKYGCDIHVYCLMTNHVHLLITPECRNMRWPDDEAPGAALHAVHQPDVPAQWHVAGRSLQVLSGAERTLSTGLLPVHPTQPPSCRHGGVSCRLSLVKLSVFNDQGMANALSSQHPLYRALSQSNGERCRQYRELFREHLEPELIDEIRRATNGNYAPGDARFSAEIEAMLRFVSRRATRKKT